MTEEGPSESSTAEASARGPVAGLMAGAALAASVPRLVKLGTYAVLACLTAGFGWWTWRRAKQMDAAGVIPGPAPVPPPPGPVPPASPPPW
jgi:hypothetical protein